MACSRDQLLDNSRDVHRNLTWIPRDIMQLTYFYSHISESETATNFVKNNSRRAGSFILRLSSKGKGYLTFSVSVAGQHIHHIQMIVKLGHSSTYYLLPQIIFPNIERLLAFYSQHRIGNEEKIDNVRLVHPINRRQRSISLPESANVNTESVNRRKIFKSNRQISAPRLVSQESEMSAISRRPPLPLPPSSHVDYPYYSRVKEQNRIEELKSLLANTEKCDCGLLLRDAALGNGWTLHRSRETITFGNFFYQDERGMTSWEIPEDVLCNLSAEKLECLKRLHDEHGQPCSLLDKRN